MSTEPQSDRAIRIGIDVGGTFTDAVAMDAETLELLGQVKVLTTHDDKDGVAAGIVLALREVLHKTDRCSDDVVFLAHGTTQATNALLEGDVATVGLVGLGKGVAGWRTRSMARLSKMTLTQSKHMPVLYAHAKGPQDIDAAIAQVRSAGADVVVGVEAFSVDDPAGEASIVEAAEAQGILATSTHVICKLYGLSKRTRTAVVNASILPRMLATSELVQSSIKAAEVTAPLMVMRCDGGVMSIDEMRARPLLTILSGPAAGAAGALLSEHVTTGIFLETGGTSTDISAIRDGRVAVANAHVGGHETYLKALDVRTVAVGGGSMVRIKGHKVSDVGPRSAHIVGLKYACFADPAELTDVSIETIRPMSDDPDDYTVLHTAHGRFAITVTCAANVLGLVPETDHAYTDPAAARIAFDTLAALTGDTAEDAARAVLDRAVHHIRPVVNALVTQYGLGDDDVVLIGGGGGAATVTPYLGTSMKVQCRIAENNAVISPIGVALAMTRDTVERVIPQPTQDDILSVRAEAERAVLAQGAAPDTIEVDVIVDPQRSLVIATAMGAADTHDRSSTGQGTVDIKADVAQALRVPQANLVQEASNDYFRVVTATRSTNKPWMRFVRPNHAVAVVTSEGVIRYRAADAAVSQVKTGDARAEIAKTIGERTFYGDSGAMLPAIRLILGSRIVDLSGLSDAEQISALVDTELARRPDDEAAIVISQVRR